MIRHVFIFWGACIAAWCAGGAVLGVYRLWDVWHELNARNRIIIIGIIAGCIAGGIHQTDTTILWMEGRFKVSDVRWSTWSYRSFATTMALALGGAVAFERCRHRGWISLLVMGLIAGCATVLAA